MRFKDKVVIITGAGSGIGRSTAIAFAAEGAKVVAVCRSVNKGKQVVSEITLTGGKAIFVPADVSDGSAVNKMVDAAIKEYGRVDILVNNAGIGIAGSIYAYSEETWDKLMDINLKGQFLCSKSVLPYMKKQSKGIIVNMSSVLGKAFLDGNVAYCTSKAAIIGFTKSLALEVAKDNIRVNVILPGSTDTPMMWDGVTEEEMESVKQEVAASQPIGRYGQPEDIANAALFLASDEASFITGSSLVVDGGLLTKIAATR